MDKSINKHISIRPFKLKMKDIKIGKENINISTINLYSFIKSSI